MTDHWDEIERLLDAAARRPPDGQPAWLDANCPPELRAEVDSLLDADARAQTFFARLEGDLAGADLAAGTRVGAWAVEGVLGRGGMGTVYAARRADGSYEQQAALKLLDHVRGDVVRRFRQERQILARLDHAGIARLIGGGATPEGRPYLVMERVDGVPVTEYAARNGLGVEARLALFEQVCEAVQYAHARLIVHRDLKPSNVLVTAGGRVKLLDFGIARIVDEDASDALTRTDQRLLTPEYAAPEQVCGEAVTTATDVYALGVLLYELLAGVRPFDLPGRMRHEAARAILEDEPTRPSLAATQAARAADASGPTRAVAARQLRGDLDTVVLKALRKAPGARYASADAFARDVARYRQGLPVEARAPSWRYRAGRFARRHRVPIAAGAVVLAGLVALGSWHVERIRAERDRAEALAAYTTGLFLSGNPMETGELRPDAPFTDVLLHAFDRAERDLAGADRLDLLHDIEGTLRALDDPRAPRLVERLDSLAHADFGAESEAAARALGIRAWLAGSRDFAAADSMYARLLPLIARTAGADSPLMASTSSDYGFQLKQNGRAEEALPHFARAIALSRASAHPDAASTLATALYHRADALANLGRPAQAQAGIDEALAAARTAYGERSVSYGMALANAASVSAVRGDSPDAARLNRLALDALAHRLEPTHSFVLQVTSNLAAHTSDSSEARAMFQRLIAVRHARGETDADFPNLIQNTATSFGASQADSALIWLARARRAYLASPRSQSPQASFPLLTTARLHLARQAWPAAESAAHTARDELSRSVGADHWLTAYAEGLVGWAQAGRGHPQGAAQMQQALSRTQAAPLGAKRDEMAAALERFQ